MARKGEPGYVYILSNPSLSCVKIGHTKNPAQHRADQLSRSQAIPTPFEVEYAGRVADCYTAEQEIHMLFDAMRVGKEFYDVSVDDAKRVLEEFYGAIPEIEYLRRLLNRTNDKLAAARRLSQQQPDRMGVSEEGGNDANIRH